MAEVRADELKKGDVLTLKGDRYTVTKAKVHGKHVRLVIDGRRGSFESDVKARTIYDRVSTDASGQKQDRVPSMGSSRGKSNDPVNDKHSPVPLHSPSGAMNRWAISPEDLIVPFDDGSDLSWDETRRSERELVDRLGARLVAVEVAGGRLLVPPVDDTTLFGHLVTMHRVRFDGVSFEEAKAWSKRNDPAARLSLEQTTTALELERARTLHEKLHVDFSAIPVPHWHQEKVPR